jgi:hypothetical protein
MDTELYINTFKDRQYKSLCGFEWSFRAAKNFINCIVIFTLSTLKNSALNLDKDIKNLSASVQSEVSENFWVWVGSLSNSAS